MECGCKSIPFPLPSVSCPFQISLRPRCQSLANIFGLASCPLPVQLIAVSERDRVGNLSLPRALVAKTLRPSSIGIPLLGQCLQCMLIKELVPISQHELGYKKQALGKLRNYYFDSSRRRWVYELVYSQTNSSKKT